MFRASERMPDLYPDAENVLPELVGDGVDDTRRVLDYWRNDVDVPGVRLDAEEQLNRRFFDTRRRQKGSKASSLSRCRRGGTTHRHRCADPASGW